MTDSERALATIRRIIRAIDVHSRALMKSHGLTGPQLALLNELARSGALMTGEIARRGYISQATVTTILDRLEKRGLVQRVRKPPDKRKVMVSLTDAGRRTLDQQPRLLQDDFVDRFEDLDAARQREIVAVLDQVAVMMDAGELESAPYLVTGPLTDDISHRPPAES